MTAPILVVDDDEDIREAIRMVLESEGFSIVLADDGEQALIRVREGPVPSLVLLDLMMPGMAGAEVSLALRHDERTAAIPIVILTGDVSGPDVARKVHADACLRKPIELEELLRTVRLFEVAGSR